MKNHKKSYGVMFHYFHDNKQFPKSQGSLSTKDLKKIINKIGIANINEPEEFILNLSKQKLKKDNVCLTFDDSLKCQLKVAIPILNRLNIKAFFFITTSIFTKKPNLIEVHRFFRERYFKKNDLFYKIFYEQLLKVSSKSKLQKFFDEEKKNFIKIKKLYSFYSISDIKFRAVRDRYLSPLQYDKIMKSLFKLKRFDYKKKIKELYFDKNDLLKISNNGHYVGLHSHTHPNNIASLSYSRQLKEFLLNKKIIEKITKKKVMCASFPRGDYNLNTLKIFNNLGLKVAFRDNPYDKILNKKLGNLEISRKNHHQV